MCLPSVHLNPKQLPEQRGCRNGDTCPPNVSEPDLRVTARMVLQHNSAEKSLLTATTANSSNAPREHQQNPEEIQSLQLKIRGGTCDGGPLGDRQRLASP